MPSAPNQSPVRTTGETVTVACRLPLGLIMQLHDFEERMSDRPDGSQRKIKVAVPASDRVVLNGCAKYRGGRHENAHEIYQGAGLTFGVPKDLFERWMEANKDSDFVKKGLVFAHVRDTRGQAVDHSNERSGMEPIDPKSVAPEFQRAIQTAA